MTLVSDLSIAALCLGSSAYLYLLHHRRTHVLLPAPQSAAYVLTNQVTHARLLPAESKHAFTYPTLSLLLSLSALESGALNRGWYGMVFGYPGLWRICGLRAQTYLADCTRSYRASSQTIREKLGQLLAPSGVRLGKVWMMTMPSFLGFEGVNPLTVYFCYGVGQDRVWGVILEVHNTFGERHAYVLQVGTGEDKADKRMKGYDHQWTFPRQFHVSPFNDRSGHYVCSVVMPSHPPPDASKSAAVTTSPPRPVINLHLLTAPPSSRLKLTALLRPVVSEPLTARTLLGAIILPPFTTPLSQDSSPASWSSLPLGAALLLTAFRIVYHAARLHYQRGLAVFARPEPAAGIGREWVEKALGGVWNDIQPTEAEYSPREDESAIGGSIGWQTESSAERWARERFEMRFGLAAVKLGLGVKIASVDPSVQVVTLGSTQASQSQEKDKGSARELVICYRSSRTWTCLLLAPTAQHALQLGSGVEKLFAVSDEQLFIDLWNTASPSMDLGPAWISSLVKAVRSHFADVPATTSISLSLPSPPYPPHPLDAPPSLALLFHACSLYLAFHAERIAFGITRARFVRGDAPWRVQDRVGREARIGAGGIGSVIE